MSYSSMSPLIFLDIDGVLNNTPWMEENGFGTLDPFNVQMLVQLIQLTNAYLVISSDWRRYHSYSVLCYRLVNDGVPDRFIGATPCLEVEVDDDEEIVPRGLEIDAWLKTKNWKGSFCILDDLSDMTPHQDRLIQTDDDYGLIERDIEKVISLLITN
jgi:hypothetical protein